VVYWAELSTGLSGSFAAAFSRSHRAPCLSFPTYCVCFAKHFAIRVGKGLCRSWAALQRGGLSSVKKESWFSGKANAGLGHSPCYWGRGGKNHSETMWGVSGTLKRFFQPGGKSASVSPISVPNWSEKPNYRCRFCNPKWRGKVWHRNDRRFSLDVCRLKERFHY